MKRIILLTIIATTISTAAQAGIHANTGTLWFNDCMKKSVPDKTNFCNALYKYINGTIQGGNPTGKGCVSHMAIHGFSGAQTKGMCYWYFTDH